MKWKTHILATLASFLVLAQAEGQKFHSINDDFPFARARCIHQDDYGFLWFGTFDGLVRFDGVSFDSWRNIPGDTNSLPGQEVLAVIQETDSTLLLGFQEMGLVSFNMYSHRSRPITLTPEASQLTVYTLEISWDSVIWVGTNSGLFAVQGTDIKHYAANDSNGLLNNVILKVYEDRNGTLWIGTYQGLHRFDTHAGTFENEITNPSFPGRIIIDMDEDPEGRLWVSVRHGDQRLYEWNAEADAFEANERFSRDGEFRITFDHMGAMWASSRGRGVHCFYEDSEDFFDPSDAWKHGLHALGLFDAFHDKYQNIWVLGEEVFRWSGDRKAFHTLEGDGYVIHSVFADADYIWYCGVDPKRWNRRTGQTEEFLAGFEMTEMRNPEAIRSQARILHFEPWGQDLVMSTTRNLILWDREADAFSEIPTNAGGPLRDFFIDDRDRAWVATNQQLALRADLRNRTFDRPEVLRPAWTAHTVTQSPDGTQWWGNRSHGLVAYDPESGVISQYQPDPDDPANSLSSFTVHDILSHSDGTIWIGTKFGLDSMDPVTREISHYPFERDAEFNTQITSLLEGEAGTLWLGTKNGLVYLDPVRDSVRRFTREDGLINTVFTERACFKDTNGVLYFGGDQGIDYFHPAQIGANPVPPDLYVRSVNVNNQPVKGDFPGREPVEIVLNPNEKFIEIELIGVHLASPHSVQYAYRMSQSDQWNNLGRNRNITLANLSPGRYTLEGKCANGDGVWSSPRRLLVIRLRPPFWQTAWFISLASAALLGLIYGIYRYRVGQVRKIEQVKTELNKRIAEIEMKALRAQMNPHFLFNSLNSVKLLIDTGNRKDAKRYLTKYGQLIRKILNNSRKKFIRMDEELETLKLYLELEQMRFKNFRYSITISPDVETDFLEIPPLLLQPYVENALWHGLMHKDRGEKILSIEVKRAAEHIVIVIEDNGIGRKQAQLIKTRSRTKKESLGLSISRDRLNFLKDLYGTEVQVEIIDHEDPTGTQVVIMLPVQD